MQPNQNLNLESLDFESNGFSSNSSNLDATTQAIELLNEALAQLTNLSTALAEQTQENTQFLNELGQGVLSQATIINDLHQHSDEFKGKLDKISAQIKETSAQATSLRESLSQIQEQQKILIKNRRQPEGQASSPVPTSFNWRSVLPLLVAQSAVFALVTVLLLNQFPPKATAKAEQQWYAIFQRVDQLYKVRHGKR